ncbi:hypothetical protein EIP75_02125 [Aquabacterium soli]|uniref:Uncharacterized protein n=1 Tax=Aquabacterium soli TaxID=2493092 RepID=A0A3R8S628_9BURK|nr:hypothetical protein [Aquabacterium soli]RRS06402.1 hypothetical protein EIP75_02125 [Aquabacterium soli]
MRTKREPRPKLKPSVPESIDEWLLPIQWPDDLHPKLKPLGKKLNGALAEVAKLKRKHENPKPPRRPTSEPDWDFSFQNWAGLVDDGYLFKVTLQRFAVRISIFQYRRALLLLSQLCRQVESAGFKVSIEKEFERLCFSLTDQTVHVRVTEKFEQVEGLRISPYGGTDPRKTRHPTGALRLHLDDTQAPPPALSDGAEEKLEGKMDLVLKAILRKHQAQTESAARWQEESRLQAIELQRRNAYEAQQAELRRVRAEERRRQTDLSREALLWHRADAVRRYVAQLDRQVGEAEEIPDGYEDWKTWALASADAIDPSSTRLRSFSEDVAPAPTERPFPARSPIVIPDPRAPKDVPAWHPNRWFTKIRR